jgi:hypothetical protein
MTSKLVPLPIPNRTVKRLSADDSADSMCEVGRIVRTLTPAREDHFRSPELFPVINLFFFLAVVRIHR